MAKRKINRGTVIGVLKWSWNGLGEVRISGLGLNMFLFEFKEERDAERALNEGPWSIDGYCMNLARWEDDKRLEDVNLNMINLLVQIHRL